MLYFLLGDSADHGQMWANSAVSDDGRMVNTIAFGERLQIGRAKSERRRNGSLTDKLFSASKDLLVSARAKTLLETARLPDDLRFIPTDLVDRTGDVLGEYFVLVSAAQFDVVDYERSELRHFVSGRETVRSIRSYCLRRSQMPDLDLFLTKHDDWNWIASQRVARLFARDGLTGFRYIPVQLAD
ncbi:MAG TPA: DUF1629 domain-containing protein [Pirellulales bacterium]|nr:DUF1629 domain-containing protein [Pirellulales bacterium]